MVLFSRTAGKPRFMVIVSSRCLVHFLNYFLHVKHPYITKVLVLSFGHRWFLQRVAINSGICMCRLFAVAVSFICYVWKDKLFRQCISYLIEGTNITNLKVSGQSAQSASVKSLTGMLAMQSASHCSLQGLKNTRFKAWKWQSKEMHKLE